MVAFGVVGDEGGGGAGGSVTVAPPAAAAPTVVTQAVNGQEVTVVTEADNGHEVTVAADRPFVVTLQGSAVAPWGLPWASGEDLALVQSSQEVDGSASATFVPLESTPGVAVRAERSGTSTEQFEVTVRVVG